MEVGKTETPKADIPESKPKAPIQPQKINIVKDIQNISTAHNNLWGLVQKLAQKIESMEVDIKKIAADNENIDKNVNRNFDTLYREVDHLRKDMDKLLKY